jgi:hypothetical protein
MIADLFGIEAGASTTVAISVPDHRQFAAAPQLKSLWTPVCLLAHIHRDTRPIGEPDLDGVLGSEDDVPERRMSGITLRPNALNVASRRGDPKADRARSGDPRGGSESTGFESS